MTRASRLLLALTLLAGCGPAYSTGPEVVIPAPLAVAAPRVVAGTVAAQDRDVAVAWTPSEPNQNCFYFSGPLDLGRDVHISGHARWSRRGSQVQLAFRGGPVFTGALVEGKLTLKLRTTYHHDGSLWKVTEAIVGTLEGSTLEGEYSYEECDTGGVHGCPSSCVLAVPLRFELPP